MNKILRANNMKHILSIALPLLLADLVACAALSCRSSDVKSKPEYHVEYYILQKSIFKELIISHPLEKISSENIDLTNISVTHGAALIPCSLSFSEPTDASGHRGYTINITSSGSKLSLNYIIHTSESASRELSFTIQASYDGYTICDRWEEMEYVAIARIFQADNPPFSWQLSSSRPDSP